MWKYLALFAVGIAVIYVVLTMAAGIVLASRTNPAVPQPVCLNVPSPKCQDSNNGGSNGQKIPNIFNPADSITVIFSVVS